MKYFFTLFIVLCFLEGFAQITEKENAALDKLIESKVEIEADALTSSVLQKMFDAEFFILKRTPLYKSNGGFSELVMMKHDGKMSEVEEAENLVPILKSDYKIADESNARDMKKALTLLLPGMGNNDKIIRNENQWILVCNEFFDDKEGFVVTTENDGKVSNIEYSSNLEF